jgi:predicted PurR-regulated permease PerM
MSEPPDTPRPVPRTVVPRWIQLVALPLIALATWSLLRAASNVLLLFLVAGVLALVLNPVVTAFQRRSRLPRPLAIVATYVALLLVLAVGGYLLANPIATQATQFGEDAPGIVDDANHTLAEVQDWLDGKGVNVELKKQGETALQTLQNNVVGGTKDIAGFGADLLRRLVETGFALVLVIVLSVYMLVYATRIGALVRSVLPPGDGTAEDDFPTRAQRAVAGYVRGQALFSLLMGLGAGLGLWLFGAAGIFPDGKTYALAFGLFFGTMELVPFLGPVLGALPPVLVALFQDPLTGVWVALLFVALQQIEGHVVAPLVFSHALRINPILVLFALLTGAQLRGIIGALLALPLAAVGRETVVYLRRHLVLEPWGTEAPLAVAGVEGDETKRDARGDERPPGAEPRDEAESSPQVPSRR